MKTWTRSIRALVFLGLTGLLLGGFPVLAQEQTGAIEGVITDEQGAPLPGVSVTIGGDTSVSGKVVMSNSQGRFRIPAVPPGTYDLTAGLEGFQSTKVSDIQVTLGARLQVNFKMGLDTVKDTIEVTATAPIISLRSSDTSAVISQEWIENLPTGRDFTSVVSQVAGANDENDLLGGISIDGASGAENRFIVDGMDTTSLQDGTSEKTLVTDFLEEVQVKASGYNAEFGGSTGGVINAVTKSGSNEFKGEVHAYLENESLPLEERAFSGFTAGDGRNEVLQLNPNTAEAEYANFDSDDFERFEPGFSIGGPIYRDKVWFFAGYSPTFWKEQRTVTFSDGVTDTFTRSNDFDYGSFNLTASLGQVYVKLSANISDRSRDNVFPSRNGTGSSDIDDYNVDREQPNESYSLNADWLVSDSVSVNLRGGHFEYDTQDSGFFTGVWTGFSTRSRGRPADLFEGFPIELDRPIGSITPSNSGTLFDHFERDFITGDVTFFVEDFGGSHEIKIGGLYEKIGNEVLDGYTNTRLLFEWGRARTDLSGNVVTGPFGVYRVLQIATQGDVESENSALYIQDSWQPTDRLTLNLGVRAEKERIPSFSARSDIPRTAIGFDYDDKIAPRAGFAYDLKGDGRWKVYGSYGVFYDNTKLELPRGLFGGDVWVDWFFGLETFDWPSIAETCVIETNAITAGPPAGCPGEFLFAVDRRRPANDPSAPTIDPNLKPFESNEFTIGIDHVINPTMSIGLRYVRKEVERAIEDVGLVDPVAGAEVFFIANPGEGVAENVLGAGFPNQPRATRDYDGITLTFRKNFSNNWALNANYTYSRLEGNYSGLASSDEDGRLSPNVNRFFDSLQGSFDANGNPVLGRLASDRPHNFKAQFLYRTPWETIIGIDQRIASGTPVSTEMSVSPNLPFFPYGRGDLGRTDTLTQTDLYLAHEFKFDDRYSVELSISVFNLFDEDAETDIFNDRLQQDLPLNEEEFFAGFDPNQVIADNNIPLDPRFGLFEERQAPRSVRLGLRFNFN